MRFVTVPPLFRAAFPRITYSVPPAGDKVLYLTFDDGPVPDATPQVLDILAAYDAQATFFCVGDNVRKYPGLYEDLLAAGHTVGNHTHNHLNAFKHPFEAYTANVEQAAEWIDSLLFRPPYGKLNCRLLRYLQERQYRVVLWSVLSYDFDRRLSPVRCADLVKRHASRGSIIVFHDNPKASRNLNYALPETLRYFAERGYRFDAL